MRQAPSTLPFSEHKRGHCLNTFLDGYNSRYRSIATNHARPDHTSFVACLSTPLFFRVLFSPFYCLSSTRALELLFTATSVKHKHAWRPSIQYICVYVFAKYSRLLRLTKADAYKSGLYNIQCTRMI